MNANEKAIHRRRARAASRMEAYVKWKLGLRWWKLKVEDEYRLIRFLQWEEKYQVSMEWMLDLLLPIWNKLYSKYSTRGIGVTIATLTGQKSETIVVKCIAEQFPDGEHKEQWRAKQQTKQWNSMQEPNLRKLPSGVDEFVVGYLARMTRQRTARLKFSRQMRRRNWRGNPWL